MGLGGFNGAVCCCYLLCVREQKLECEALAACCFWLRLWQHVAVAANQKSYGERLYY